MTEVPAPARTRILAVVVLYGQLPSQSVTVQTLVRALRAAPSADCRVCIYDNSPSGDGPPADLAEIPGLSYVPMQSNRGLYGPYEAARLDAGTRGCDWLLTLDQDTALPEDFFSALEPGLQAAAENPRIAAIVPHLAEGACLLSPSYVTLTRPKPLPRSFSGIPEGEVRAFNSAALLRVAALQEIGGFDPCFWLDHLDSWLHRQLYLRGWRVFVLGSVHLEHHFSLLNYKERVSSAHFRNFLGAESAYIDLYGSWLARRAYTAQLGVRLLNQHRRGESPEILQATRNALRRQLTMTRSQRIAEWRAIQGGCPGVQVQG